MAHEVGLKQGTTFQLLITALNDDDTPFDLSGVVVIAQLRDTRSQLIDTLQMTSTSLNQLVVQQASDLWPLGRLFCDFKLTESTTGVVLKSQTLGVQVEQAISA